MCIFQSLIFTVQSKECKCDDSNCALRQKSVIYHYLQPSDENLDNFNTSLVFLFSALEWDVPGRDLGSVNDPGEFMGCIRTLSRVQLKKNM